MDFKTLLKTDFKITTDARTVKPGGVFLALKGIRADDEEVNAHCFVKQAFDNGAAYAIVSESVADVPQDKLITVDNTFEAYGAIGNKFRHQFKGKVIGLTGSSGKTSTKEALKQMLSHFGKVYATPKNLNSRLGVPQVLCDIDMTADYAIIEMGMSHIGEMAKLSAMVEPDIAMVLNVFPMHLDYFESVEQIAFEKAQIFKSLKRDGIAIYNADSLHADLLAEHAAGFKTLSFGEKSEDITLKKVDNTIAHVKIDGAIKHYALPEDNIAFRYNTLAVIAVFKALHLDLDKLLPLLKDIKPADERGTILPIKYNGKRITLVDDSYGGGHAVSMEIGLQRLMNTKGKRKIAVIGNMAELGNQMKKQHKRVGKILNRLKIDKLFLVGEPTLWIKEELGPDKKVTYVSKLEDLGTQVEDMLKFGDVLFIKGAHYSSQVYKLAERLKKG
ncbi:MAG: UDP-N-acetylmuramoyl-tripeptide--D-alanyl-D-alanine ligase [Alphaproteobacteria bacterium]|nr:UDP-N-acetylmuramoyl-tripeptide--D-alanyl-D-alanine ligase [Alphaproteobacteria bacterium]MBN2780120.1 UDP-N-acetylmuramoyl-tripeptide--D-alanyl-D-alanine ligase [Alphaproteobacteria bacterium]